MKAPVQVPGELVVVMRNAPSQETHHMFVDEVEPEESVPPHALRVAQASEDMPWCCYGEKDQYSWVRPEHTPTSILASDSQKHGHSANEEHHSDKPLGQHSKGERSPECEGIRTKTDGSISA